MSGLRTITFLTGKFHLMWLLTLSLMVHGEDEISIVEILRHLFGASDN